MTIVIWGSDRAAFPQPPELHYVHKTIPGRRKVRHYRGVAEMVVTSPAQIQEK
jgi:hypothetical protein